MHRGTDVEVLVVRRGLREFLAIAVPDTGQVL
jgi:hypothetical protein